MLVSTPAALRKPFLVFLAPMMLSNILQSLFGTINNVYLGQMIGVDALAAVSVFFPAMFFFISFVMGLGSGASVLIGQAWGAKEPAKVKAIAGTTLTVTLLLAGVIALGGLFSRELLTALATPANILDAAAGYARIMMITMPLTFAYILLSSQMRAVGDTVTPLAALAASTSLGLVLTPVFIRGWLGAPQLGVASAAWASAISTLMTLTLLHVYLRRRKHPLAFDAAFLRGMRPDPKLLRIVLRLGIPAAIGMIVMSLAEMVLIGLVNGFGSDATAAYGAVNQVLGYVQFPALSIAISVSIFGAQAIGRGNAEQIGRIVRTGIEMNVLLTGSLVAIGYLFSRTLMGFFITDPAVIEVAQRSLHIVLWSSVMFGMSTTFSAAMRASGTVWMPLAISAFAIAAIEVPTATWLSRSIGLDGVWIAYPVTFTAMMLLQMSYYLLVWRKRTVRRMI
ncbi:putative multi antimicrobial extrusion protein [Bradyrhizobium oligotrophicum S58]|uniref:Putative multi antimicrobial extrusion protein n=1 Tax=Bradyrhizobium oligotrophicum S58 TaxID=1245469 RepID=M4Z044_9BRAD|nr:MATE family efflux transporter [Bradyrhizobium oligotrophicum]BAM86353.1 putative multi antimicrobial extrusion protein [Bradyrhizobium oligotrophicum S58]